MRANTFEGGSDATIISPANSGGASGNAFDLVDSAADSIGEYDAAVARDGMAGMFATRATVGRSAVRWNGLSITGTTYGRIYICMGATPVTNHVRFLSALNAAVTTCFSFQWTVANKLVLLDSATAAQATSTTTLTSRLDTWLRFEWEVVLSLTVGQITCRMYDADDISPFETLATPATINVKADIEQYMIGPGSQTLNANMPTATDFVWLDNLVVDSVDWPGPAAAAGAGLDSFGPARYTLNHPTFGPF
jgi:hypothetical protein